MNAQKKNDFLALEKKKTVKMMGKEKQCVDLAYFWLGKNHSPSVVVPFNFKINGPFQQGSLIIHLPLPALNFRRKVIKLIYWQLEKKIRKLERETLSLTFET